MLLALRRALVERVPAIHHSDQGAQYVVGDYIDLLKEHHIRISEVIGIRGFCRCVGPDWAFHRVKHYGLQIDYIYIPADADGTSIFSCDNASHHPEVRTFSHHKHRYPKEQFPLRGFPEI